MKSILLGSKVVVSDPCYSIPTWCQAIVTGVNPGHFNVHVVKTKESGWGTRCCHLIAIHSDYCNENEKFKWESYPAIIGVDSGQAGIFSFTSYRKDELAEQIGNGDGDNLGDDWATEDGDKWYEKMCTRTLGNESWGTYSEGVVSSSGIGDGSYELLVAKKKKKIIGFVINFYLDNRSIKSVVNDEFLSKF